MFNRAVRSPPSFPLKPPERCPHCDSPNITTKGRRLKKLEIVRLYICRACDRRFTPCRRLRAQAGGRWDILNGRSFPV